MSFLGWMALAGGLLLFMALSSAWIRNLPISTSAIYLALGLAIGPLGLDWLRIDLREEVRWFERLTEVAVIVALFVGGLKLRLPLRDPAWVAGPAARRTHHAGEHRRCRRLSDAAARPEPGHRTADTARCWRRPIRCWPAW